VAKLIATIPDTDGGHTVTSPLPSRFHWSPSPVAPCPLRHACVVWRQAPDTRLSPAHVISQLYYLCSMVSPMPYVHC
jgi:hypothetical protein